MRKILGVGAVAMLVLAACGKSSGGTQTGGGSPNGGGVMALTVNTRSVPKLGTVLVDGQGHTLYHLTTESGSHIVCTGSCTSTWPPLLWSGNGSPQGGTKVTGTLATLQRPDHGTQVTYKGLTLYTYAGDSKPGQANGQGIQGVWFAVTPTGLAGKSSTGGGGGGGYHYGGSSPSSGGGY